MGTGAAWARAGLVAALVVGLDQVVKGIVAAGVDRGERVDLLPFVDVVNVRNRGIAFGFLADGQAMVILITAAALALLLGYFATHAAMPGLWLPTGLVLGGAVGNLIDRLRIDEVVDFVKLPGWPAFNVADVSITFGVLALLLVVERNARRHDAARKGAEERQREGDPA